MILVIALTLIIAYAITTLVVYRQTIHIMVARGNTDQTLALCLFIIFLIFLHEGCHIAFTSSGEERLLAAEQIVIMRRSKMK